METREEQEYRLSPRVTLRPGDTIAVSRGPYWRSAGGEKLPMAARGRFRFLHALHRGRLTLLVAVGRQGVAILHVEGRRRNKLIPELVCRAYRVRRVGERRRPRMKKRQQEV
jgi:hypothetical protein